MRESDDDPIPGSEGPDYVTDPHKRTGPRVKSAKKGKDMDHAIESIKELRQSLANNAILQPQNLSPTTGLVLILLQYNFHNSSKFLEGFQVILLCRL